MSRTQQDQPTQPARVRAEELFDRMGQSISHYTALAGLQIQRAVAWVREDAEDMWVEAQNLRRRNGRRPS